MYAPNTVEANSYGSTPYLYSCKKRHFEDVGEDPEILLPKLTQKMRFNSFDSSSNSPVQSNSFLSPSRKTKFYEFNKGNSDATSQFNSKYPKLSDTSNGLENVDGNANSVFIPSPKTDSDQLTRSPIITEPPEGLSVSSNINHSLHSKNQALSLLTYDYDYHYPVPSFYSNNSNSLALVDKNIPIIIQRNSTFADEINPYAIIPYSTSVMSYNNQILPDSVVINNNYNSNYIVTEYDTEEDGMQDSMEGVSYNVCNQHVFTNQCNSQSSYDDNNTNTINYNNSTNNSTMDMEL